MRGESSGRILFLTLLGAVLLLGLPVRAADLESDAYNIMRGGMLYDKWLKETAGADLPTETHPGYPKDGKLSKSSSWRCPACHGVDYKGKDGVSGKDAHAKGIQGAAGHPVDKLVAVLKDKHHGFTADMLPKKDMEQVALFVAKGQIDMDKYIDRASGKAKGDAAKGKNVFTTLCAKCHGLDGKKESAVNLPKLATGKPHEALHRIFFSTSGDKMTSLGAFDPQISADVLAYIATLPQ